jgi:cbb3-type cytochrome c oxidase subunit III
VNFKKQPIISGIDRGSRKTQALATKGLKMDKHRDVAKGRPNFRLFAAGLMLLGVAFGFAIFHQATGAASAAEAVSQQGRLGSQPPLEYGEWVAKPEELVSFGVNEIVKSIRLNATAMTVGREVYDKHCVECHGADLKGSREHHAPDLTDANWMFSGDDLVSGGLTKFPSDVEWTIRYGIRSGNPYARGVEADMLAFDPQYRNKEDTEDFGDKKFLTDAEIADVTEYVLKLGGQRADPAKARRGDKLFHDNAKGNCFDCHTDEGTGNDAIGSINLTKPKLYLYGSDRATIIETITKGRRGVMPAFEDQLSPIELKAVSVFVFSSARIDESWRLGASNRTSGRRGAGAKGAARASGGLTGSSRQTAR